MDRQVNINTVVMELYCHINPLSTVVVNILLSVCFLLSYSVLAATASWFYITVNLKPGVKLLPITPSGTSTCLSFILQTRSH